MTDFWTTADEIPALPGAYVLAINLSELVVVSICRKPSAVLAPGCYLYCGSAKGPGGLAARLARHMRHGKAIRWHVDGLTEAGTVLGAWTFPGGDECDLVAALSHLPVPIEGFGSSDCRRCRSHLLHADRIPRPRELFGAGWSETRCCLIFGSDVAPGEELRRWFPQDPRRFPPILE
jgi:Uri superfamily endonuclease